MRILITGSEGYIGSVLTEMLVREGHQVTGLDIGYFSDCFMPETSRSPQFGPRQALQAQVRKDIRDVKPADLVGFDAVVHLAALSNDPIGALRPEWTAQINVEGTLHLAGTAREAGVKKFLFSSSCSVYGESMREAATEYSPLKPMSAYAVSKARAEEGLEKLGRTDFSPVFLRNATVYGTSPRMRLDLVVNNLTAWAFTSGCARVSSDGTPWRPLIHVEDAARAFASILTSPRDAIHNRAFNVGIDTENYQVRGIAEAVRDAVPGSVIRYAGDAGPDFRNYRVDFGKIRADIPTFQPKWTVEKGIAAMLPAFSQADLKTADLNHRNYVRIRQLHHLLETAALDADLRWNPSREEAAPELAATERN